MAALDLLFRPRHVAVVGASADPAKVAGLPIAFLRRSGFAGAIYPVNKRVSTIDGLPCVPDVATLPEAPDVAMVLLGAGGTLDAVRALAARGARHAIVLASGFGEAGPEGARLQDALREAAGPMRLLGPNTIGLVNVTDGVPLSASGALATGLAGRGAVGVVSQSGGILGALLSRMNAAGVGLSKLVATGNEVDLELADFIEALAEDADTTVLALYIEAIRHPGRFRVAVRRALSAGKAVVALKVGRSAAGARAAASHTGAMAGSDRAYDALFAELGVIRAQTFGELIDLPAALSTQPPLRGRRIAVLTSTGGAGTLVADAIGSAGLDAPPPGAAVVAQLRACMRMNEGLDTNPIDLTLAGLQPDTLSGCVRALVDSPAYDALVVIVGSSAVSRPELVSDAVEAAGSGRDKPVLAYVSPHAPEAAARLMAQRVPAFQAPESVAAALRALGGREAVPMGEPFDPVKLRPEPEGSLDEQQAKVLFAAFGVPSVREAVVCDAAEAEEAAAAMGGPVVLKLLSSAVTHKTELGGVVTGLAAGAVGPALGAMRARLLAAGQPRPERYLVQAMVSGGLELILGARRDPLGTVLLLGLGGVAAELTGDTAIRLLPEEGALSADAADAMMRELKAWPLLDGYRGRMRLDTRALAAAIVGFSRMAAQLGDRLLEAEINPLFVLPDGVLAADGVAVLAPTMQDAAQRKERPR